jgi:hypothetical protein
MRRVLIALVAIGFIVLNPIHLPLSVRWLADRYAGTGLGRFLLDNEVTIVIVGTVYFTAVMIPVYYWLWTRRRRPSAPDAVARARGRGAVAAEANSEPYRGPGGGKREPPSMRRRHTSRRRR